MLMRIKKPLILVGILLFLTLIIPVLGILALKAGPAQRLALGLVNGAIPGTISLEELHFSLLRGNIALIGASLQGADGEDLAEFDHLFVDWSWTGFVSGEIRVESLVLEGPQATLRTDEDGGLTLVRAFVNTGPKEDPTVAEPAGETGGGFPFNVVVVDVRLVDGSVDYANAAGDLRAEGHQIGLSAAADLGRLSGALDLQVGRGRFTGQGLDVRVEPFTLKMGLDRGRADLDMTSSFASGGLALEGQVDVAKAFADGFLALGIDLESITYDLVLTAKGIVLSDLLIDESPVGGTVDSRIDLAGAGFSPKTMAASFKAGLTASGISVGDGAAPMDVTVEAAAGIDGGAVLVERLHAEAGSLSLRADGRFDLTSEEVTAALALEAPDLAGSASSFGVEGVGGGVTLRAGLSGTAKEPLFDIDLKGGELQFRDVTIGNVEARAGLDRSGVLRVDRAEVVNGNSTLKVTGMAGIFDPEGAGFAEDPAIDVDFVATALHLEDFVKGLAGEVSLRARLEGNVKSPRGRVSLAGNTIELPGQRLEGFELAALLKGDRALIDPVRVVVAQGESIEGMGWVSLKKAFEFRLESKGISLGSIDAVGDEAIAEGTIRLLLTGDGTFDDPHVEGEIVVDPVVVMGRALEPFKIGLDLREGVARVSGDLDFGADASYDLKGKGFTARLAFEDTDLSSYLSMAGHAGMGARMTGWIEAAGNASELKAIEVEADLSEFAFRHNERDLARGQDLKASFRGGEIVMPGTRIYLLERGWVELWGRGGLEGQIDFHADGLIPLDLVALFVDDLPGLNGELVLDGSVGGTLETPDLRAAIEMRNVGFDLPTLVQSVENVNGRIEIVPGTVRIEHVAGRLDAGRFEASGKVGLDRFEPVDLDLSVSARALPVIVPETLDLLLNADLTLRGTAESASVRGELVLLDGTYFKDVNVSLLHTAGAATQKKRDAIVPEPRETLPLLKNTSLDVAVKARNPFVVDNNLAVMEINPDLQVSGKLTNPIVSGRAEIASGTITYQKKSFVVKKGAVDFLNPYRIEPTVNITSEVKIRQWLITLKITGTPDRLVFRFSSDPAEEDGDILSLIVFGKTTRELVEGKGGAAQKTTEQMLAELIASTFGDEIKEATGIDILEVETRGNDEKEDLDRIQVTLGKELTRRMTVKYAVESKDGEMSQRAIGEYRLFEHILMSGFQDTKGVFGGELLYRIEFR